MRKNETYEVLAVETFCFAAVCAVSVFFKKLAPDTAFVFGAPIRAVWLRAVAAAVLFAAFAVSIKLIADREHGKNSRKTAMTAAKIFFPATALIACVNAAMCIAENGFSPSVMPTVAAIISVVGHAVSLALIIKEKNGAAKYVFAAMTLSLMSTALSFCADCGQKTISEKKRFPMCFLHLLSLSLAARYLTRGEIWVSFVLLILTFAVFVPMLMSFGAPEEKQKLASAE